MATDPWAGFEPVNTAQPAPRIIPGTPRPGADVDLQRDQIGLQRDQVGLRQAEINLQQAQQEAQNGGGADSTEGERKAAAFLRRALGANINYERQRVGPRGQLGQAVQDISPNILNALPLPLGNSPQRQVADSAENEFIAASLRQDSGAQIPPQEMEMQRRIYFPTPGEGPEAIAQKREARRRVIEGLISSSGRSLDPELRAEVEAWLASLDQPTPPPGSPPADDPEGLQVHTGETESEASARVEAEMARRGLVLLGRDADGSERWGPPPSRRDDQTLNFIENSINASNPITGGLTRAVSGTFGQETGNAFTRGIHNVPTLGLDDELRAAIGAGLGQGNFDDNLNRERAVDRFDENNNFGARLSGQVAGGFVLPMSRTGSLGRLMAEGAAFGTGYGFGSGEGDGRLQSAGVGLATGAGAGVLARVLGGGPAGARVLDDSPVDIAALARAAREENVRISRPIADPSARTTAARLEASVGGNRPVRESMANTATDIERGVTSIGAGGNARETGAMGQRIQSAALTHLDNEGRRIGNIYTAAARQAERDGVPAFSATEAVRVLDENLATLRRNPKTNRATISYLEGVRSDFVDDAGNLIPKTIQDVRDIRTNLRGSINERNLGHSPAERIVGQALDAARTDIQREVGEVSPAALRLYNQADRQWAARGEARRQVVQAIVGNADNPISGGDVMARITSMSRKDAPRLRRLWAMLSPEDRADAAATIAATAGRANPGDDFSPAHFVKWAGQIPESARSVIFGADGARSIANLQMLSRELRNTQRAMNNSRSGMVSNFRAFLQEFTTGGGVGAAVGAVGGGSIAAAGLGGIAVAGTLAGGSALARRLSARALMSHDMTKWLAAGARATSDGAVRAHIRRLSSVAARDPAIAAEITGLQRALLAVNDNAVPAAGRAAASENERPADQQPR